MPLAPFLDPAAVTKTVAEILLPPRRVLPTEAVRRYLRNDKGAWNPALAGPQLEPLDLLAGRQYTGIVYVGPSRGSKTYTLIFGGLTYVITCAPGDTQITQMSNDMAREMSKKDIERVFTASPELGSRLSPRPRDDNVFDKYFRNGMALTFGWPTASQHSSKTLKYMFITDYDQAKNRDDVDGKGALWDVAFARIRTFLSRGKCLAESSPSGEFTDPQWRPSTPHEAPPATGITAIYNRGTRARLYWPCLGCGEFYESKPGLDNFRLPAFEELEEGVKKRDIAWLADQFARIACPHCGYVHEIQHKPEMSQRARWVHEGEKIEQDGAAGKITGERRRTHIASFWQSGVSASYQRWDQMLMTYLQGVLQYVQTGDESSLKATTNTDQAMPYLPRAIAKRRSAEVLQKRAESWERGTVPPGVRFITVAGDVQGNRFAVQVEGWGIGLECWILEYFEITASNRREGDKNAGLQPSAYEEDWDVLIEPMIERKYRVEGLENAALQPLLGFIDSGGQKGTTTNALKFWRRLKAKNKGKRLMLCRGNQKVTSKRVEMTWPDSSGRKDRESGSVGDVPIWSLNVNVIKDGIAGDLAREVPGPGYVHFPDWLPPSWYDGLTSETRKAQRWVNQPGARNEPIDLHTYNRAICIAIKAESIDWNKPPEWAAPLDQRRAVNTVSAPAEPKGRRMRSRGIT